MSDSINYYHQILNQSQRDPYHSPHSLCSALNEVYLHLRSAGTELYCCGCFSASTCDTAALVSLIAASPIPMSLADGRPKELLLKNLRRAMSTIYRGAMHVD